MSALPFGVVVLAAGASSRMGRSKLLLPWRDTTVIGGILAQWCELGSEQNVVVCRPDDAALLGELDRAKQVHRVFNSEADRGMFTSIRLAARWDGWTSQLTHFAIALGDQPHLSRATLETVIAAAQQFPDQICQPAYGGRGRHPVLLPRKHFLALADTRHMTLKEFLVAHASSVQRIEVTDPGVDFDLDTPDDYRAAVERFGSMKTE
jgi:molybdenum cofactor cytidylyltransferase